MKIVEWKCTSKYCEVISAETLPDLSDALHPATNKSFSFNNGDGASTVAWGGVPSVRAHQNASPAVGTEILGGNDGIHDDRA